MNIHVYTFIFVTVKSPYSQHTLNNISIFFLNLKLCSSKNMEKKPTNNDLIIGL